MAQPNGAAEWRSRMAKTCLMVFLCNLFTFKAMHAQEQHSFSCGTPHHTADNLMPDKDMLAKIATVSPPCGGDSIFHIRTVVHFFLKHDGTGNFNEFDDGRTSDPIPSGEPSNYHQLWNGYRYAAEVIHAANALWRTNSTMLNLNPTGCSFTAPPVPAIKIQYTLVGVYFHRMSPTNNNAVTNAYAGLSLLNSTYAVNPSNTLNIVFGDYKSPDGVAYSVPAGPGYVMTATTNEWRRYTPANNWTNLVWGSITHTTLNHEVGHILGLFHTFQFSGADYCSDTPPCPQGSTNNLMDYGIQKTITPEQLDRMYTCLNGTPLLPGPTSTAHFPAYKYECNPCSPAYSYSRVHEKCADVYLAGGWYGTWTTAHNQFIEIFETNAIGSNTVTGPYYSGWFSVTSADVYLRKLNTLYTFIPGRIYKIKSAVNSSCTGWHESSNWITYSGAVNQQQCGGGGNNGGERIAYTENKVQIYPNPASNELNFVLPQMPEVSVQAVVTDITGKTVQTTVLKDTYTRWNIELPNGIYLVRIPELNHIQKIIIQH